MRTSGTSTESVVIPPGLQDYFSGAFSGITQAGQDFPSISQLPGAVPLLNVPGLTPEQQNVINMLYGTGTAPADLSAARAQLQQLTGGPIGSSPATQAGMQAFQELTLPSLMQTAALQGNASGGAALEAAQQGATAAAVPLIQQEIANRQAAVGQYGNLQQQQMQSLAAALEASGIPRDVAMQQAQAQFQKAMQGFGIEQQVQMTPLDIITSLLGRTGFQQQHPTMTGEDWLGVGLGAIGGALGGLGL